ncbi:hypothetical protein DESC_190090 [Desulfosarcina cetonica]|nr:hypothetical protein DESC_190090 [Desulfosarcina cetonica]
MVLFIDSITKNLTPKMRPGGNLFSFGTGLCYEKRIQRQRIPQDEFPCMSF